MKIRLKDVKFVSNDDVQLDVWRVQHKDADWLRGPGGNPITQTEIRPEVAATIAGQWQSSGAIGSALAALASGAEVDHEAVLDDIAATRQSLTIADDLWAFGALDCLAVFVIGLAQKGGAS